MKRTQKREKQIMCLYVLMLAVLVPIVRIIGIVGNFGMSISIAVSVVCVMLYLAQLYYLVKLLKRI